MSEFLKRKLLGLFLTSLFLLSGIITGYLNVGKAVALTQISNWAFTGNSTGWSSTNAQGTDACGTTTSTNKTSMATFAYSTNTWRAISGTAAAGQYKGRINQTFVVPGTGTVKVKGRFKFSATVAGGGSWGSGYTRLDVYNSTNSTYIGNLACASYTSNQSNIITSFGSLDLTGGTTYTIRVTMFAQVSSKAITTLVDEVVVSTAPIGLTASVVSQSSDSSLSWTTSTAGSGAPGLNATTPYKVYRDTSSPVSTFLANSTTNSYTDTTTVGNTTYYYAVSNVDTNSVESDLSTESSVLTLPDTPGTPTFSNVDTSSMTINWNAPTGGASTYKIERCTGVSCSDYAEIASGVVSTSYNDTGLSSNSLYRYRVRGVNASGNGDYSGIAEQDTSTAAVVSVTITTDGTVAYGALGYGESSSTVSLADTQTAQNDGNVPVDLNIKTSAPEGWALGATAGNDIFTHEFSINGGSNWTKFTTADSYQSLITNLAANGTQDFDLRLTAPNPSTSSSQKTITITIQAVQN